MPGERAFFRRDGDGFAANDAARGPWSADACHGGPVAGLMVGALEKLVPHKQLVRITVNFLRPVPMQDIRVAATLERDGRSTACAAVTVRTSAGICATASSLHIAARAFSGIPTTEIGAPEFARAAAADFPLRRAPHGQPYLGDAVEVARAADEPAQARPVTLWMRAPPIVAGETSSPFQTLCPLADCGNGISANGPFGDTSFVNPDLTVVVFRLPESEWLASRALSSWQPSGIGLAQAQLFDTRGAIGFALQSLLVQPMGK